MVELEDLAILVMNFGAAEEVEPTEGDADGDADVDLADLARLLSAFGLPCE
jgi:hypothetical protein